MDQQDASARHTIALRPNRSQRDWALPSRRVSGRCRAGGRDTRRPQPAQRWPDAVRSGEHGRYKTCCKCRMASHGRSLKTLELSGCVRSLAACTNCWPD